MSNPAQFCKYQTAIMPAAIVDNAAWTGVEIDTLGWDYLELMFLYGTSDIALAALAVTQSDTAGSGHANVTGTVFGTATDIAGTTTVLPSATDDGCVEAFQIDLRGKKRYFNVAATAGDGTAGTYAAAVWRLSRGEAAPKTSAAAGADFLCRVE